MTPAEVEATVHQAERMQSSRDGMGEAVRAYAGGSQSAAEYSRVCADLARQAAASAEMVPWPWSLAKPRPAMWRRIVCSLFGHGETQPDFEIPADGSRRRRFETCLRCGARWRAA
jgi:hypothetical protein